jgi:hypothetical protein
LILLVVAAVLVVLCPTFFVGGLAVKASSALKANRLEQSGIPVTAQLSDYRPGRRSRTADVWLAYQYGGHSYRIRVECRDDDLCRPDRTPAIEIKVDPEQPAEFVTAAGSTDDSRNVFNSWGTVIVGFVFSIVGGFLAYVRLTLDHDFSQPGDRARRKGRKRRRSR